MKTNDYFTTMIMVCLLMLSTGFNGLKAQGKPMPAAEDSTQDKDNNDFDLKPRRNPDIAALMGFIPGMGRLYLKDYSGAVVQATIFTAMSASSIVYQERNDYIPQRERTVEYDPLQAILGEELNRRGYLYMNTPFFTESALQRDMRLVSQGEIYEWNPLSEYGNYLRRNKTTTLMEVTRQTAFHAMAYSVYSSYRDAKGIFPEETYTDLFTAPFQYDIIKDPAVFVPAIVVGAVTALGAAKGQFPVTVAEPDMMRDGSFLVMSTTALFNSGVGEELLFRGYLNHSLSDKLGPVSGALVSSAIFAGAHYLPDPEQDPGNLMMRFAHGLYLSWLQRKEGYDLRKAIANHFWYDLAYFAVYAAATYRSDSAVNRSRRDIMFQPVFYSMRF